ncbi:sensor histidine kinase KdpD [Rhodoferax sp. PAMC 29310]|uniref:sensor histidine kinase n=1 Tax=Rhodoferax sp. PAMC 29310 TaxID=2822760 RepID=UPI001B320C7B|nr:HAMP domain-containing sensor histidine kinase [Rhodoferax sp. PAMC 29310]
MEKPYHQPSVDALFDAVPWPVITLALNGKVTYANVAARQHPGNPVQEMNGRPSIASSIRDFLTGKVKLPHALELEWANGHRLRGQFMPGPAGIGGREISFIATPTASDVEASGPKRMSLSDIIDLLRQELQSPFKRLSDTLGDLPQTPQSERLEDAANALKERLHRLSDLVAIFGDEVIVANERVELAHMVQTICKELEPRATSMKIRFEVAEPNQTLPAIYGSAQLIRRALHECIDNALTHSQRDLNRQQFIAVKINYMMTGEHVLITLRNQAELTAETRGIEIREPFEKTSKRNTSPSNGRLGLPLVQRIVELHGGRMRVSTVDDDEVKVMIEFPIGAPLRGQAKLDAAQTQRYATDLALLMSRRKKEK